MLPADAGDTSEGRTPADNATARSVFIIGPDKKVKATLTYPMSTGRNFDEILRLLDSCRLTATRKVATPVNWKQGDDVIILPAVSDDDAKRPIRRVEIAVALHPHRPPASVIGIRQDQGFEVRRLRTGGIVPTFRATHPLGSRSAAGGLSPA